MIEERDIQLGQLAVARNTVTLDGLLSCISGYSQESGSLGQRLLQRGLISSEDLEELEHTLEFASVEALSEELRACDAIVFDELARTLDSQSAFFVKKTLESSDSTAETLDFHDFVSVSEQRFSLDTTEHRYELLDELGRGGMGRVLRMRDRALKRDVALKTSLSNTADDIFERLLLEAHITGSLEHPNIIPLYDLGVMPDGTPYYTMRVIRELSLQEILHREKASEASHSLIQFVTLLRQVCLAVHYAHDHGVIHRDLKPENILVGKYGEVYVIDWGIAKVLEHHRQSEDYQLTQDGSIIGTPQYMAPEQALGEQEQIDARTDVYALGAILYEILTLEPVFDSSQILALLFKVVNESPIAPSQRAPQRNIPRALEDICLKALNKDASQRYQSAQEMADDLNLFLEGIKERERRREQALLLIEKANQTRESYKAKQNRLNELLSLLSAEQQRVPTWAPPSDKEALWQLEQDVEELKIAMDRNFGEAVRLYGQAISHESLAEARQALAEMHWERFREAEIAGDRAQSAYFESLVQQYNDGQYNALLEGNAHLDISVEPRDAKAILYRYESVHRRLTPSQVTQWESFPVQMFSVPHGSYLLEISRDGFIPLRIPLFLDRQQHESVEIKLRAESTLPEDFVVVSKGRFLSGNIQPGNLQNHHKDLPDFAIMRFPVTCAQYLEFLNDIARTDLELARSHAPRMGDDAPSYFPLHDDNQFILPEQDAEGDSWHPDWPICMVNFFDAQAYARWRSERDNMHYRIPSADEWEKAARGVDGRLYPWGNHFDAAFCRMRESIRGKAMPVPIGTFSADCSVYGVMDMAGNILEWTSSWASEQDQTKVLHGASFTSIALMCRLDWHLSSPASYRLHSYGFRLAMSLDD